MASLCCFTIPPLIALKKNPRLQVQVCSLGDDDDSAVLSSDSVEVNGASKVGEKERFGSWVGKGNGRLKTEVEVKKRVEDKFPKKLEPLWDDGYGTETVTDYFDAAKQIIEPDGGPPRWFSPISCGKPLKDAPILLFLPGMDGTGMGLVLHHKALGKFFEVWCLHIPVYDRTSFEELVKFVEETVRHEHALSPNKPIYLVGDSFGGCLALSVAARNAKIDLVLILSNPATSFDRSQLQPFFPIMEALPDNLHWTVPYLLGYIMGDPRKMAMVNVETRMSPMQRNEKLSRNLAALLPYLSFLVDIIPKDTLLWKLKLLKSAAAYTNSRLHAVKAEVLVLSSGKDNMVPSGDEAQRLKSKLQDCVVRHFKDNGHTFLLEDGINLMTVIKGTSKYRLSRRLDCITDYMPPSMSEFKYAFNEAVGLYRILTSSVMLSTLEDGKIVRGLSGVPNEGPVLLVGYHNLLGLEIFSLAEEFLREKQIMVRGVAHPHLFVESSRGSLPDFSMPDWLRVFGAFPASPSNLFKSLSAKSFVLLYPGGAREALHNKGEEYKLVWPDQPEFVRMAASFGATIVPFAAVGEDDLAQVVLDYNDLQKIPIVNESIRKWNRDVVRLRHQTSGKAANTDLFLPGILPKIPGRFYYLFGKPIETKGKKEILKDRESANKCYLQIKSQVENNLAYLLEKRKDDPYRNIFDRTLFKALYAPLHDIPSFEP